MARPLRIEYEGAFYHVTSRGNRKEHIFLCDRDKDCFLDVLRAAKNRYGINIHAFVLMNNHYHFLIETPNANLSAAMRHINGNYTQWFNHRHKRAGHVLQGRYKSILVDRDEYYLELIRYIHLNPVRAGIMEEVDGYRWSSHRAIINERAAKEWRDFYDRDNVLRNFGSGRGQAIRAYKSFVSAGLRVQRKDMFKGLSYGYVLGETPFVEWVLHNFVDREQINREIAGSRVFKRGFNFDDVLSSICIICGASRKDLLSIRRGRNARNKARLLAMYLLTRHSAMTQKEIGRLFGGVSDVAVSNSVRACEEEMKTNKPLRKNCRELMEILKIS